jgi:hypothetical protein
MTLRLLQCGGVFLGVRVLGEGDGPGDGHTRNPEFAGDGPEAFALLLHGHRYVGIHFSVGMATMNTQREDLGFGHGERDPDLE